MFFLGGGCRGPEWQLVGMLKNNIRPAEGIFMAAEVFAHATISESRKPILLRYVAPESVDIYGARWV